MNTPQTVIVTRHAGLLAYLQEIGLADHNTPVIEHATAELIEGRRVIGVLPLWLAAWADTVTEIPLNIPAELRGQELSVEQMRQYAGEPASYEVRRISPGPPNPRM